MSVKRRDLQLLADYRDGLRRTPRLTYLFFEITDRCNMRCRHCGSCSSPEGGTFLSREDIERVLMDVREHFPENSVMVCLTGGEPLLHPEFDDIARAVFELGFPWGITTNGLLLDRERLERLRGCGLGSVTLSLDGLEGTNDWFRGVRSFRTILERIRLIREAGLAVQVTTVVHRKNYGELDELFELMLGMDIQSWRLTSMDPIGRGALEPGLMLTAEEYRGLFDFIRDKRFNGDQEMEVTYGCAHYLTEEYERELRDYYFICGAGIYVAGVLSNGDITSCLDIERRPGLIQGNIRRDLVSEVWKNRFQEFRRDRTEDCGECRSCPDRQVCGGDSAHTWNYDLKRPNICIKRMLEDTGGEAGNGYSEM